MNIPPPSDKVLPLKVEHGDPLLVHVEYNGERFLLRLTTTVLAVWPAGGPPGPDGIPRFNVQMAPVMVITKEPHA